MNLKKILSLSVGLVLLATVAVLTGTGTVGASPHINSLIASPPPPSVPVNVVNTPLAVSISGTPTVNANIGTPSVNATITGAPNVNVANTSLTIGNPVLVSEMADTYNQECSWLLCQTNDPTNAYCAQNSTPPTVPSFTADSRPVKRLVIEFVSGSCTATPGDSIETVSINTPGLSGNSYFVVPVLVFSNSSGSSWSFAQMTKIYAYPGSQVALSSQSYQQVGSFENCGATIVGHLVTQ